MGKNLALMLFHSWMHKRNKKILSDLFEEQVRRSPEKPAVIFANDDHTWSFRELNEYSNTVANHFSRLGLQKGDTVALFMENSPEYIGLTVGLWKIGVTVAFINHNLRHESFTHCVRAAKSRALVFSPSLAGEVASVCSDLVESGMDVEGMCFSVCGDPDDSSGDRSFKRLDRELKGVSTRSPPPLTNKGMDGESAVCDIQYIYSYSVSCVCLVCADKACYVYTSGTTGLPKACVIRHSK